MRYLDMQTWPRREHYNLFSRFDHPHFGLCANVDVTALRKYARRSGASFSVTVVYLIARAANTIPEFRQRIRDKQVVEHGCVHPSFTVLTGHELFGFCTIDYIEDFRRFAMNAADQMAYAKAHPRLENEAGRDDLLYITAMPWVSFTGFVHPMQQHPADSIPRFAFGKVFGDARLRQMPLSVQGHHAVMDGIHIGQLYTQIQDYLSEPDLALGSTNG